MSSRTRARYTVLLFLLLAISGAALSSCTAPEQQSGPMPSLAPGPDASADFTDSEHSHEAEQHTDPVPITGKDCLRASMVIDKLNNLQLGGITIEELPELSAAIDSYSGTMPADFQDILNSLKKQTDAKRENSQSWSANSFAAEIDPFRTWNFQHCGKSLR